MIEFDGEHTTATIHTDDVDEACIEQVEEIADHEAFQNPIEIMPDAHYGSGAVIGFTMELGERICPNTVGVDIGCGMTGFNLGEDLSVEVNAEQWDNEIRERVPMGRDTFNDVAASQDYNIHDDFPWEECTEKARTFNTKTQIDVEVDDEYGPDYFDNLCQRVGHSPSRAINSLGTLGGGNHFIEISEGANDYWVVVHSGSRGIGYAIADYWQNRAHENCDDRAQKIRSVLGNSGVPSWAYKPNLGGVSDDDLINWVLGGMGEDWKNVEEIKERRDGEEIGNLIDTLNEIAQTARLYDTEHDLDYLDGEQRAGYLKDMIFAQTYAKESRVRMCETVADVVGRIPRDWINSTHNYIDFDDQIIRKGATRAHLGEDGIIPFNMRDGAVIVSGVGNDDWNQSAPHGAGRRGSRTWAYDTFDVEEYEDEMEGVYSSSVNISTLDEAPMAYKDTDTIMDLMEETVAIEAVLEPKLNIKAEE